MIKRIDEFISRVHGVCVPCGTYEHQLMSCVGKIVRCEEADKNGLPVGESMADVCIHLFDVCKSFHITPYRSDEEIPSLSDDWLEEFGDISFMEQCTALIFLLLSDPYCVENNNGEIMGAALHFIYYWSKKLDIDIAQEIEKKLTQEK